MPNPDREEKQMVNISTLTNFWQTNVSRLVGCMMPMLVTVLLSGCGSGDRAKIVGTWKLESVNALAKRVGAGVENDESNLTEKQNSTNDQPAGADNESSNMLVEFASNGSLMTRTQMRTINRDKQGGWSFLEFDEEKNVVKIECTVGLQVTEHAIEILDKDTIEMVPPNMAGLKTKLKFKRTDQTIRRQKN